MSKLPTVLWAQRADKVMVSIQLEDVTEEKITVDDSKLSFSAKCHGDTYAVDLEFNGTICPQDSKQRKGGREYYFDLKKKEEGYWPRLLKDATKYRHIKIDFNRWKDEDDESEDEAAGGKAGMYDDASLEDMMQQMGTGGGSFDPGEAPDSEDSDDEDIPDLEDESGSKVES